LFVLEQKELEQKDFEIMLYGLPVDWDQLETFKTFFTAKVTIDEKVEKGELFLLAKQLLCV
jgi:hypothetical protein